MGMNSMTLSPARLAQVFAAIGHFQVHFFTACYAFIVVGLVGEWKNSYEDLLTLWTIGAFLFGAAALPAGWLGDRWSARGMMAVYFVGIGAAAIVCGLSDGRTAMVIGLGAIGLFAAIYHPVGIAWLVRNCQAQGKTLGLNGVFGNYGVGFAGIIAGGLMDFAGWRAAFIVPGVIAVVTGVVFILLAASGRLVEGDPAVRREQAPSRSDMTRGLGILLLNMLCAGVIFQGVQYALPKALDEKNAALFGDGLFGLGAAYTIIFFVAGTLQYIGGHLADRYPPRLVYILAYAVQVPLLALVAALANLPMVAVAILSVTLAVGVFPAENVLFIRYTPERHRSLAFGIRFVIAFGVGPLAVQLIAAIYERTGAVASLFVLLAACAGLVALSALFLPGERRAAAAPQAAE
jgi:MFS family permease